MHVLVRDGLFTDGDPPALLGTRCAACGSVHFPRADACTYCATEDPEPIELSRRGTLWAWTAVTAPPPGYHGEVPFGVGVVELPEGVRIITRLTESDPGALAAGPADGAAHRAAAPGRGRERRGHVRLRAGMTGVSVAGVGLHPFGRFDGVSTTDMGVVAVRAALREAGIGKGDFQAAFCGTAYGGVATGHKVLSRLGMTGMPIVDVEAGCASGGAALMLAAAAIRAGQYDTVLVFGTEKMPKGIIRSSFFEPWQEEAGLASTPAFFGLRAQRLCITSGVTKDHLARVVVKNRRHGASNPDAMYQKETTAEAVLGSRIVCDPLHLFMLCSPNEGAAALVLRRADLAPSGVTLAAAVLRSHIPGSVLSESTPLAGLARRRRAGADDAGCHRRLRGGRPRPLRPARRGVPGHGRRPRAGLVRRARVVRARAARPRSSIRAPPRWAAVSRSTRAGACSRRASRSAPPPSGRWSSWCASCEASVGRARSKGPAWRCRTRWAGAPTPAS